MLAHLNHPYTLHNMIEHLGEEPSSTSKEHISVIAYFRRDQVVVISAHLRSDIMSYHNPSLTVCACVRCWCDIRISYYVQLLNYCTLMATKMAQPKVTLEVCWRDKTRRASRTSCT